MAATKKNILEERKREEASYARRRKKEGETRVTPEFRFDLRRREGGSRDKTLIEPCTATGLSKTA